MRIDVDVSNMHFIDVKPDHLMLARFGPAPDLVGTCVVHIDRMGIRFPCFRLKIGSNNVTFLLANNSDSKEFESLGMTANEWLNEHAYRRKLVLCVKVLLEKLGEASDFFVSINCVYWLELVGITEITAGNKELAETMCRDVVGLLYEYAEQYRQAA